MSLTFYCETHIPKDATDQLRARGVLIVRAQEIGMADAEDSNHLERATSEGWVLVTGDDDFLSLADRWNTDERQHAGIVFIQSEVLQAGQRGVGAIVRTLLFFHESVEIGAATVKDDFYNRIRYLSLTGWS